MSFKVNRELSSDKKVFNLQTFANTSKVFATFVLGMLVVLVDFFESHDSIQVAKCGSSTPLTVATKNKGVRASAFEFKS